MIPDSLRDPRMEPVWAAARARLDRGGQSRRRFIQPELTPHSRHCLIGLLGREPTKRIDLATIESALVERGVGSDLGDALSQLGHPPSLEAIRRRAEKARISEVTEALNARVATWPEPWADQWARNVRRSRLLSGLDGRRASCLTHRVRMILDHLDDNPDAASSRTELAARLYGSSHALDGNKRLYRFVEHALRLRSDCPHLDGRELFEHVGIEHSLVGAPVLTWAIPAMGNDPLGRQIRAANGGALPLHISLYALRQYRVEVPPETRVLIVENPRLVEAAAQGRLPACVIASSGTPTTAVTTLLEQLADTDVRIWFHTDFDQGGFRIGNLWHARGYQPWMMARSDYLTAVNSSENTGLGLPVDVNPSACGEAAWDQDLRPAYLSKCLKVHEELICDVVLDGFAAHGKLQTTQQRK